MPYGPSGDRITDLMLRSGEIAADGARRSGQIWGGALNNVGEIAGGAIQQHAKQQAVKKQQDGLRAQDEAFMALLDASGGAPDPKDVLKIYGPKRGMEIAQGMESFAKLSRGRGDEAMKALPGLIRGMDALSEPLRANMYPAVRSKAVETGLFPEDAIPPEYNPETWTQISAFGKSMANEQPKTREIKVRNPDGSESIEIVEDAPGLKRTSAAVPPKPETVTVPGPDGRPMAKSVTPEQLAAGVPIYQKPEAPTTPSRFWVVRNGKSARVSEADVQPGDTPWQAPQNQRLTKEERQDFAAWDYALPKLDAFSAYVEANPDKWGKWDAVAQTVKQALPGFADAEYASQDAFIARMNAEIRHALYGAALTEAEKETAKPFMIEKSDQPTVIIAKVREAQRRAQANVEYYRDLGFNLPRGSQERDTAPKAKRPNPFRSDR